MQLLTREDIKIATSISWKQEAFRDFDAIITSPETLFPCTLGVAGFGANQLRFSFIDSDLESDEAASTLAATLQSYIPNARSFGKNTSLVVFFKESGNLGIDAYEAHFWDLLNKLRSFDTRAWPRTIPQNTNDPHWEFSFAGEPIFVVCNTPSHQQRKSRYASRFMITFQPRWVFDGVIGNNAPNSKRIKDEIQRRLRLFDAIEPSPELGAYGTTGNNEWKQYFLGENNNPKVTGCPFHSTSTVSKPAVQKTNVTDLILAIADLLPPTGSIEIERDTPYRIHSLHSHQTDETLHIVQGEIEFQLNGATMHCSAGDRLLLPATTPHASIAGKLGCLYVIATRIVGTQESLTNGQKVTHV